MSEEIVVESSGDSGSTVVDQGGFVEDFFNESNYELINDDGSPLSPGDKKPNAEKAKIELIEPKAPPAPVARGGQGQQPATGNQQAAPTDSKPPSEVLMQSFLDEGGGVKDDVLDFFAIGKDQGFRYQRPAAPEPQNPAEAKPDDRPAWQRQYDEDMQYENNLRTNMLGPIGRINELIAAGHDPAAVISHVTNEYNEKLQQHMRERDYQKKYEAQGNVESQRAHVAEMQELRPKSITNIGQVANEVGGMERFEQLMYSDVGGPIVNFLFDLQNPDKGALSRAELVPHLNEWWTKFTANENNLRLAVNMAKASLQQRMWPKIVERVRAGAVQQNASNKRATMPRPTGLTAAPATNRNVPQTDALDRYLSSGIDEL